jgi:hypothetical protein
MPFKNRIFLIVLLVLVIAVAAVFLAPMMMSNGVRLWVWWFARQEGFVATIDGVDAPFLRPIVIHQIHLKSARDDAVHVDVTLVDARVALNLKHIFLHLSGRDIRNISVREFRAELRRKDPKMRTLSERGWVTLHRLLPETLNITRLETRVEDGPSLILLRNASLSASETEPGRFTAAELMITSPWIRQSFSQLRGATHWEANRLTLAGLTLIHGLDLQAATLDLARLGNRRIGLQFDVDAFGGKLRTNISHEWHSPHSNWNIAGGAADLSLAQISDALGFADRVNGLLHSSNFTFRGNLAEPDRATASLWGELTGLTWRERTAEALMLGAALYNRKIELQQLHIRQKGNQFTLSGEAALPATSSEWLRPDFRGNISASINQLGEFLALFGANPADFAGKISIEGSMDTHARNFGGNLSIEGRSLTFFKHDIDSFSAKVSLKPRELDIERFELARKKDSVSGDGKIDLSPEHKYSGNLEAWAEDLRDYVPALTASSKQNAKPIPVELQATVDSSQWDTRGAIQLPKSNPVSFTANFQLPIGTTWNAFQMSPLNVSIDFPAVFVAGVPQFFHSNILQDGILSGKISLSETLEHPRIVGEVQLVNGKLADSSLISDIIGASGLAIFDGNRATLEFLNFATKEVDLALHGEIDFENTKRIVVKLAGATPIFDLMSRPVDCVNKIEIAPAAMPLAPATTELQFRGPFLQSGWSVSLKEELGSQFSVVSEPDTAERTFALCFGSGPEQKVLSLGAVPRAEVAVNTPVPKKEKER